VNNVDVHVKMLYNALNAKSILVGVKAKMNRDRYPSSNGE